MRNKREELSKILCLLVIIGVWLFYALFIVNPLLKVPIWTVGGLLAFIGALALGVAFVILSILMFMATFIV